MVSTPRPSRRPSWDIGGRVAGSAGHSAARPRGAASKFAPWCSCRGCGRNPAPPPPYSGGMEGRMKRNELVNLRHAGILCFSFMIAGLALAAEGQPEAPKNLKYFPKDITRDELIGKMRQFSFALGVPCTHCHGTAEQTTFDLLGVDFSTDLKPTKNKARDMLRMTDEINSKLLAKIPHSDLNLKVACVTCHSGLALPETIEARVLRNVKAQ